MMFPESCSIEHVSIHAGLGVGLDLAEHDPALERVFEQRNCGEDLVDVGFDRLDFHDAPPPVLEAKV